MKAADILYAFFVTLRVDELSMLQLMALASPFGITETNVRSALSRMHSRNLIEVRKEGRAAFYRVGARGQRLGSNVGRHFHDPDWSSWDGSYWAAAFSLSDSRARYRLQKKLLAYRFRALYPGLWIRPFHPAENVPGVFSDALQAGGFDLFNGSFVGEISRERIAELYDLPATAAALQQALRAARRSSKAVSALSPEAAFTEWLTTGDALVKALFHDPLLPPALLPDTWPASELRQIFGRWNTLYSERSAPFVRQALNQ